MPLPVPNLKVTTTWVWTYQGENITAKVAVDENTSNLATSHMQVISSTSEAIDLGDVTDPAHLVLLNTTPSFKDSGGDAKDPVAKAAYDVKYMVYVTTSATATKPPAADLNRVALRPQDGFALVGPPAAWAAIVETNDVDLFIAAVQVPS